MVVTEYADKELYDILDKQGRLSEERAQVIACDLVSALYYLHSNRVMHRFVSNPVGRFDRYHDNDICFLFSEILSHRMFFWRQTAWLSFVILDLLAA